MTHIRVANDDGRGAERHDHRHRQLEVAVQNQDKHGETGDVVGNVGNVGHVGIKTSRVANTCTPLCERRSCMGDHIPESPQRFGTPKYLLWRNPAAASFWMRLVWNEKNVHELQFRWEAHTHYEHNSMLILFLPLS